MKRHTRREYHDRSIGILAFNDLPTVAIKLTQRGTVTRE
jgi:hypothetical protein